MFTFNQSVLATAISNVSCEKFSHCDMPQAIGFCIGLRASQEFDRANKMSPWDPILMWKIFTLWHGTGDGILKCFVFIEALTLKSVVESQLLLDILNMLNNNHRWWMLYDDSCWTIVINGQWVIVPRNVSNKSNKKIFVTIATKVWPDIQPSIQTQGANALGELRFLKMEHT